MAQPPDDAQITTTVQLNVPAVLRLVPEYGPERDATVADLNRMGWKHRDSFYPRLRKVTDAAGLDTDHGATAIIRELMEFITWYDNEQWYPDDIERLRRIVAAADAADAAGELTDEEIETAAAKYTPTTD